MDLASALDHLATTDNLLIVTDFDGTLAGFSPDPAAVPVNTEACEVLTNLASAPATTVAVLSGRGLQDLKSVCPLREPVVLAGSHGAEGPGGTNLTLDMRVRLNSVGRRLSDVAAKYGPDVWVESKPYQRVLHVARLAEKDPDAATDAMAKAQLVDPAGTKMLPGKNIVEFSASPSNKGSWLRGAKSHFDATAVLFIGDDATDEHGFAALGEDDVSIKVGPGDTVARYRVEFGDGVTEVFRTLRAARQ